MMRKLKSVSGAVLMALFAVATARAELPGNLKGLVFSGEISPVDEERVMSMTFRIYDAPANGVCRWGRNYSVCVAKGGAFDQILSDEQGDGKSVGGLTNDLTTAIAACLQATGGAWVELAVGSAESTPLPFSARQKLLSVPSALMAAKARSCELAFAPSLVCEKGLTVTGQVATAVLYDRLENAHSIRAQGCSTNGVATLLLRKATVALSSDHYLVGLERFQPSLTMFYEIQVPTVRYLQIVRDGWSESYRSVIEMPAVAGATNVVPTSYGASGVTNFIYDARYYCDQYPIGGSNRKFEKK